MSRYSIILILICLMSFGYAKAEPTYTSPIVLNGVVYENGSKKKIANVSIAVPGSNIGTVSNSDGGFSIRIPEEYAHGVIAVEQIGYLNEELPIDSLRNLGEVFAVRLVPTAKMLKEVVVRGGKAEDIIAEAMKKIPQNYSSDRSMFTAFYRETIQKGRRYTGVAEAIVDVMKSPYSRRNTFGERVQVKKGRKLMSQNKRDTISVKILGGPTLPIILDFVKNEDLLFDNQFREFYGFSMESPVTLDDRLQFRIRFTPKVKTDYPLWSGVVYVDQETLSFTKAEFEMDMSDKEKATRALLRKRPRGLRFNPQDVEFTVTYRLIDGVSYLNYVHARSRFKCDWKRRLFSSGYTTDAEMVMIDRTDSPQEGISRKMAFGQNEIFDDKVAAYWDDAFWEDYNIIAPTETLEKAVGKLIKNRAKALAMWDFE